MLNRLCLANILLLLAICSTLKISVQFAKIDEEKDYCLACFSDTCRTQESLVSYKNVALKCKTAIEKLTDEYENRLVSGENLGAFHRYADKKFCFKSAVGPLQDESGSITIDAERKADLLQ
jgi:hypothetical protein